MGYRKLRIAWSVVWGIATVLLIVLWVRSYWKAEAVTFYETNADYIDIFLRRWIVAINCTTNPRLPHKIREIH